MSKPTKMPQKSKQTAPKKGPGKKTLALMQEQLKKLKDEEEKVRQEEEDLNRKFEEAEKARQLEIQREKERKEKKKQRDKERIEKLKAEGKYLTGKQRFERARARTLLDSLKPGAVINNSEVEKNDNSIDKKEETSSSESESIDNDVSKTNVSY